MDIEKLLSLLPLLVAVIGGIFVLISSVTAKEKETKLNKYESIGFETYAFMEDCAGYFSRMYWEIYKKLTLGAAISIQDIDTIIKNISPHHPDVKKGRELSVSLTYVDQKSSKLFNKYLDDFSSVYNEVANITHINNLAKYNIKSAHTHEEANEILSKIYKIIEETKTSKLRITQILSKKYNSTINYSKNLSKLCITILLLFICAYLYLNHSKKIASSTLKESSIYIKPATPPK